MSVDTVWRGRAAVLVSAATVRLRGGALSPAAIVFRTRVPVPDSAATVRPAVSPARRLFRARGPASAVISPPRKLFRARGPASAVTSPARRLLRARAVVVLSPAARVPAGVALLSPRAPAALAVGDFPALAESLTGAAFPDTLAALVPVVAAVVTVVFRAFVAVGAAAAAVLRAEPTDPAVADLAAAREAG
ncbi:hypothetical protein [Actinoplanes sp. HUAS TT8]|uniref:hypothetical protein n=1 Tax=Actinoplanes sp. HUAS TT8 TaxID=3447453 RepID=UPI003F5228B8